jgi:hypothetical protein
MSPDTGGVDDSARVRVAFPCEQEDCLREAATVEVTRRGQLYIDEDQDMIYRIFPSAQGTIRVTGFLLYTNVCDRVPDIKATLAAVHAIDTAALYAMRREWVPFYCSECGRSFCGEHWNLKATFDWGFDFYSGTCPVGHPHVVGH